MHKGGHGGAALGHAVHAHHGGLPQVGTRGVEALVRRRGRIVHLQLLEDCGEQAGWADGRQGGVGWGVAEGGIPEREREAAAVERRLVGRRSGSCDSRSPAPPGWSTKLQ